MRPKCVGISSPRNWILLPSTLWAWCLQQLLLSGCWHPADRLGLLRSCLGKAWFPIFPTTSLTHLDLCGITPAPADWHPSLPSSQNSVLWVSSLVPQLWACPNLLWQPENLQTQILSHPSPSHLFKGVLWALVHLWVFMPISGTKWLVVLIDICSIIATSCGLTWLHPQCSEQSARLLVKPLVLGSRGYLRRHQRGQWEGIQTTTQMAASNPLTLIHQLHHLQHQQIPQRKKPKDLLCPFKTSVKEGNNWIFVIFFFLSWHWWFHWTVGLFLTWILFCQGLLSHLFFCHILLNGIYGEFNVQEWFNQLWISFPGGGAREYMFWMTVSQVLYIVFSCLEIQGIIFFATCFELAKRTVVLSKYEVVSLANLKSWCGGGCSIIFLTRKKNQKTRKDLLRK